jgi:hypothetical protein
VLELRARPAKAMAAVSNWCWVRRMPAARGVRPDLETDDMVMVGLSFRAFCGKERGPECEHHELSTWMAAGEVGLSHPCSPKKGAAFRMTPR